MNMSITPRGIANQIVCFLKPTHTHYGGYVLNFHYVMCSLYILSFKKILLLAIAFLEYVPNQAKTRN